MEEKMITCVSCHVAFRDPEKHREHFQSPWHSYNLKRKIANLPPISHSEFLAKVAAQQEKEKEEELKSFSSSCVVCNKHYSSENAYLNHLSSKKHKENEAKYQFDDANKKKKEKDSQKEKKAKPTITEDMTEEEIIDQKIAAAKTLSLEECLFCCHQSSSLVDNLDHMAVEHTFFLPDLQYLEDVEGMIRYLGEKISVGNVCLYCNGKGKSFHSLEAVQKHMMDKGHCKIFYEGDASLEFSDYYDFRPSYPDYKEGEEEEGDDEDYDFEANAPVISSNEVELILPNGKRAGHRSLNRYYKQKFRPEDERTSVMIDRLMGKYRALGWHGDGQGVKSRERIEHLRVLQRKNMELGVKANDLQRHFRRQVDF